MFERRRRMKICSRCVLPESYPGISFDNEGVCNFCREYDKSRKVTKRHFETEDELIENLKKYRNIGKKYDVLVPLSGGVDSTYMLIQLVKKYGLRPLCFHNDHGYEDERATQNAKNVCRQLGVDLIIKQQDMKFMKKLWKYVYESNVPGLTSCYTCSNILYMNAVEIANNYGINLLINGFSKGQAEMLNDPKLGIGMLKEMQKIIREKHDKEFYEEFMAKFELLPKIEVYHDKSTLEKEVNREKVLVIPFFVFNFNKTDKEKLREEITKFCDWRPLTTSYPSRTTNCCMNWLGTYVDHKKMGFSVYDEEYAELVRSGDFTREQALEDLKYNPPEGLLEKLSDDLDYKLK